MSQDPIQPPRGGRISPRARVVVSREGRQEIATVVDNEGPAYLVRFGDGTEGWYDRASVERDNPDGSGSLPSG